MKEEIIATLKNEQRRETLQIGTTKSQNFWVRYTDLQLEGEEAYKEFDTMADATARYLKLAGWILLGAYGSKSRKEYLMTGTLK